MASPVCLLLVIVAAAHAATLSLDIHADFSYDLVIDNLVWLRSAPTSVTVGGQTFTTRNGSLRLLSTKNSTGADAGGSYTRYEASWAAGSNTWVTFARVYEQNIVFGQYFPTDFNGTSIGTNEHLLSTFPGFLIESYQGGQRGFVSYGGAMIGGMPGTTKVDLWDPATTSLGTGINGSGPVVLFNEDVSTTLVLGAFSNFMVHSQDKVDDALVYGILGSVESVPAGFAIETLVTLSHGVSDAVLAWGDRLLAQYGKNRFAYKRDFILTHLGYSTDNGAYYYYNTEPGTNYEDTMIAVRAYADSVGIPYTYVLLDSWWYYKGFNSGVSRWDARPDIFPHGLEYLYNKTGWPTQLHNRYWATNNTYAKQNGGKWDFIIDPKMAIPTDADFWNHLITDKRDTGMLMYEQDWLDVQFDNTPALQASATLARQWMLQMGAAAARAGVTIQECMSYVRHVLQSVEMPAVTNARASDDYQPGTNSQWMIGTSSILAHAVGLAPSKDNYWSTDNQPGAIYHVNFEPYNRLQAAVSSLSTGPVAPADKIGLSNAALIKMACMSDGTLLQPDAPAMAIDAQFIQQAFGSGGAAGELWSTFTRIGDYRVSYVFAATMTAPYTLSSAELGYDASTALAVAEANTTATAAVFDAGHPLNVKACGRWDFQLYTASPVISGWALLGEPDKWVRVSNTRFADPAFSDEVFAVSVRGVPGEVVHVDVRRPNGSVVTTDCTIPAGSVSQLIVTPSINKCDSI
eukprot:m.240269 g.240269  ORF g.240269 m.240269 type:complete len:744 (+) comp13641_c0_seq1:87-2318(+)